MSYEEFIGFVKKYNRYYDVLTNLDTCKGLRLKIDKFLNADYCCPFFLIK